jgi:hypothetical protein
MIITHFPYVNSPILAIANLASAKPARRRLSPRCPYAEPRKFSALGHLNFPIRQTAGKNPAHVESI